MTLGATEAVGTTSGSIMAAGWRPQLSRPSHGVSAHTVPEAPGCRGSNTLHRHMVSHHWTGVGVLEVQSAEKFWKFHSPKAPLVDPVRQLVMDQVPLDAETSGGTYREFPAYKVDMARQSRVLVLKGIFQTL